MNKHTELRLASLAFSGLVLLLLCQVAAAAPHAARAVVTHIAGAVEYREDGQTYWQRLRTGMALSEGTAVHTAEESVVDLALTTGAIIRVGGYSAARLDKLTLETKGLPGTTTTVRQTRLTLEQGQLFCRVKKLEPGSSFQVTTPLGLVEVTGTEFLVDKSFIRVISGELVLKGDRVRAGQQISGSGQPMPAPGDDAIASLYKAFKAETAGLDGIVLEGEFVDLQRLMSLLRAKEGVVAPFMTVANPAVEVSPTIPDRRPAKPPFTP